QRRLAEVYSFPSARSAIRSAWAFFDGIAIVARASQDALAVVACAGKNVRYHRPVTLVAVASGPLALHDEKREFILLDLCGGLLEPVDRHRQSRPAGAKRKGC